MKLTEEQLKSWRKALAESYGVGPYAYIAPVEQIERIASRFQDFMDTFSKLDDSAALAGKESGRCAKKSEYT